jgi:hypothetical protein
MTEFMITPGLQLHSEVILAVSVHRCPDPECQQLVVLVARGDNILYSFPTSRINFDSTAIPPKVISSFEEALTCRAHNCYTAAAIMLRKTLEVLCDDLKIKGGNLKDRVKLLSGRAVLPPKLLEGLDDIRLLGNDAAHINSKTFGNISAAEIDICAEVIKEVFKGIYQYDNLVNQLQMLKKLHEAEPVLEEAATADEAIVPEA